MADGGAAVAGWGVAGGGGGTAAGGGAAGAAADVPRNRNTLFEALLHRNLYWYHNKKHKKWMQKVLSSQENGQSYRFLLDFFHVFGANVGLLNWRELHEYFQSAAFVAAEGWQGAQDRWDEPLMVQQSNNRRPGACCKGTQSGLWECWSSSSSAW